MSILTATRPRPADAGMRLSGMAAYPDPEPGLPEHALLKLRDVSQAAADAHAVSRGLADQVDRLHTRLTRERQEIERLTRDGTATRGYPEGHPVVAAARATEKHTTAEIARVEARRETAKAASAALRSLAKAVETWVEKNRHRPLLMEAGPAPKARRGADLTREIEGRRAAIRDRLRAIGEVEAAPIPAAEAKERARQQIDRLAAQAMPDVGPLVDRGMAMTWPSLPREAVTPAVVPGGGFIHTPGTIHDGLAVMAWLHRDAMVAAVDRQIELAADDENAIASGERPARVSALRAEILALEREEEALILMALEEGLSPTRRPDADPRAVLQLAFGGGGQVPAEPAPAAAA